MKLVGQAARRIDQWLQGQFPEKSRSVFQKLIRAGHVLLRGEPCHCNATVRERDPIEVFFPPPAPSELKPEAMPLEVLFEDDHLLVVNKPAGLVVHPGAGHFQGTLAHALLHHCRGKLSGIGGVERPGIVHRLDQATSGCLIVAKSDAAHQGLSAAFKARRIEKIYHALVWGVPRAFSGKIEKPIGRHPVHRKKMAVTEKGRSAVTHWKVLEKYSNAALVECRLETGRTHQIRVHLASMGHPILGDHLYGRRGGPSRQMLHARRLGFEHPISHQFLLCEAPWPVDLKGEIKRQKTF